VGLLQQCQSSRLEYWKSKTRKDPSDSEQDRRRNGG